MPERQKITTMLWFDGNAEAAAKFYVSLFKDSAIHQTTHYSPASSQASGRPAGSVMTVAFRLAGRDFVALNGGPHFKFTEAVSFVVNCETQREIDELWAKLTEGGDPKAQQCGWLKDKFGLSWQVVPAALPELMKGHHGDRVMAEIMQMKKIDLTRLEAVGAGR